MLAVCCTSKVDASKLHTCAGDGIAGLQRLTVEACHCTWHLSTIQVLQWLLNQGQSHMLSQPSKGTSIIISIKSRNQMTTLHETTINICDYTAHRTPIHHATADVPLQFNTRLKSIKSVTGCRDGRSAKKQKTRKDKKVQFTTLLYIHI